MNTNAITIPNSLPTTIVALEAKTVEQIQRLVDGMGDLATLDAFDDEAASKATRAYDAAKKLERAIEASRKELKAPILELGKALDAAASEAMQPLAEARRKLDPLLLRWQQVKEEERQAAEAERRRLIELQRQQEREAAAARARAEAEAAAAAARDAALADPDDDDFDPLAAMEQRSVVAQAAVHVPAPIHVPEKVAAVTKTVTTRRQANLVIHAPEWLPRTVTDATGVVHQLMVVDEAAVKRALLAGCDVSVHARNAGRSPDAPVAEIVYEDVIVSTGRGGR